MSKIPKLRFKEFSGEWESKKLGTLALLVKDGTHGTHTDVEYGPYLLSAKNIKDGKIIITRDDRKISYEDYKAIYKSYSLKKDDILLSIVGTIGRIAVMPQMEDIAFQRSVAILRFNLDARYVYQYMNTNIFQNQLLKKQVVSAQPGIYLNDLKKLDISIPSKEEQEKIASFFSLIDDKISIQSEKVEALKDYKKGMMQKIFSRELRFKDDEGRDYPEWEEKKLGDIASICTGKKDTQDKIDDGIYPFFVRSQVIERINSYSYDGEAILTAGDGVGVGKVFHYINGKFDYHQRVYKISDFSENTYGRYVYEYFRVNFIREVTKYTAKTSVDSVKMKIPYPVLDEQIKIADVLKNIDLKIEKEQEKLDSLNEYKKGLLQQMFV